MKIIAWYYLILHVLSLILRPMDIGKERKPITGGSAAITTILQLPLLYLAWQLVFGGIL